MAGNFPDGVTDYDIDRAMGAPRWRPDADTLADLAYERLKEEIACEIIETVTRLDQ